MDEKSSLQKFPKRKLDDLQHNIAESFYILVEEKDQFTFVQKIEAYQAL